MPSPQDSVINTISGPSKSCPVTFAQIFSNFVVFFMLRNKIGFICIQSVSILCHVLFFGYFLQAFPRIQEFKALCACLHHVIMSRIL